MSTSTTDTIAAIGTAAGRGGIGIIRISGTRAEVIGTKITGKILSPRVAIVSDFSDTKGEILDQGLAIFFPEFRSYTGEPVVELQGHGSPIVLDQLLSRVLDLGARLARPGEFTERAFINGRIDLSQAEAVADLIGSKTAEQAQLAARTMLGLFRKHVEPLDDRVLHERARLEALLDFPDEELPKKLVDEVIKSVFGILNDLTELIRLTKRSAKFCAGNRVVIAGIPNVGKSSVFNRLCREENAIVTDIPGTTRDILRAELVIGCHSVLLIDTAGIRESDDPVENEGVKRARTEIAQADVVLWVYDGEGLDEVSERYIYSISDSVPVVLIRNKIDLTRGNGSENGALLDVAVGLKNIRLSAMTGFGFDDLDNTLRDILGNEGDSDGLFLAKGRHVCALGNARTFLARAYQQLSSGGSIEVVSEDLRSVNNEFGSIIGTVTNTMLLDQIFGEFCIGK